MSKTTKVLTSVADVEAAMNEMQRAQAALESKTNFANAKIADVRDEVVSEVSPLEERVKRIKSQIEAWAEDHREDAELFPNGAKTLDLQAGTISFRLGAEKVVLKKGIKTADVIERALDGGLKKVLTTPDPELDKKAVKDLYESGRLTDADLKKLGLEITQDESINIKLKTIEAYK